MDDIKCTYPNCQCTAMCPAWHRDRAENLLKVDEVSELKDIIRNLVTAFSGYVYTESQSDAIRNANEVL